MAVNQEIQKIAEIIRQAVPAERIYLFGSHAYGTPNEHSDYDFYVIIPDGSMRPIEAMQKAYRALYPMASTIPNVDVVASTQRNFDVMRHRVNTIEEDIAGKGVLLYERYGLGTQVA
jgi:predicted nucleotidyltransferase